MQLYFAPLEGIGGYLYRNTQAAFFPKADKYFSPFIAPNQNRGLNNKERRDVLPENNDTLRLVPQILTNNAEYFGITAMDLMALGYQEINLNLGCPSNTVVKKTRGAGFLGSLETLEPFLEQIFQHADQKGYKISIKTRLGMTDPEEFQEILDIYNQYPVHELIIHPRVQKDYYKNHPNLEAFAKALEVAKMPVVYNGDVNTVAGYEELLARFPQVHTVMAGRGVLADPCLFGEIRGEETLTKARLKEFHEGLLEAYSGKLYGDAVILFKMKEHWFYMSHSFTNSAKYLKRIRKCQRLTDYKAEVRRLFAEQEIQPSDFGQ